MSINASKWALITGASSGIGRQIAVQLAVDGYRIIVNHFDQPADAEQTLALVRQAGSDGIAIAADVGIKAQVVAMFQQLRDQKIALHALVNNAAVQTFASLIDLKEEDFDRTIRTNLKGTFLCTQQAAQCMLETGGVIVNIGSGANHIPFPKLGDYCASKGGIEMLTKVAAVELGRYKIRVHCIAPGAIENERTRRESPEYGATWAKLTPLGRAGTVEDVAQLVSFLVGPNSSFMSGHTVYVDGGLWGRNQWPYEF